MASDRSTANADLDAYHAAGGTDCKACTIPAAKTVDAEQRPSTFPDRCGPSAAWRLSRRILRKRTSCRLLARNVVTNGFQASHSNDALEQTEYLKLVHRYLTQARELEKLAGASKIIKVDTCESPEAGELLRSSASVCAAVAAVKWCWRRSMPRGHSSPPTPASRSPNWKPPFARTVRSLTISILRKYQYYMAPNIG